MVRDLANEAVRIVEKEEFVKVESQAIRQANKTLVRLLVPGVKRNNRQNQMQQMQEMMQSLLAGGGMPEETEEVTDEIRNQRLSVAEKLDRGLLENEEVTIEVEQAPKANPMGDMMGQMGMDMSSMLGDMLPKKKVKRTLPVGQARKLLVQEEEKKLVNYDDIYQKAMDRAGQSGIIFIDEIDKITAADKRNSAGVSREGVQRDILPIVEGSTVSTKYGPLSTDHILFIAAGAFAESKPSDLIPELQGRFPIRVELNALTKDDFVRILKDPQNSLLKQYIALLKADGVDLVLGERNEQRGQGDERMMIYIALLKADGVDLVFTAEAVDKIAEIAFEVNQGTDNIGARRLATILEKLLEEVLYEGPDMEMGQITITQAYVEQKLSDIVKNKDLTKFIL